VDYGDSALFAKPILAFAVHALMDESSRLLPTLLWKRLQSGRRPL
jgi:hypothetical protein